MTDREIADLISLCSQWWPNWRNPESLEVMVRAWRFQLADVPYDAGLAALSEHSANGSEFPPPVGVVRLRAAQLTMPAGRAPAPDEAWQNVLAEISRAGILSSTIDVVPEDRKPRFAHPAIEAVVRAMGWRDLCTSTNAIADRAHFVRLYQERVTRQAQERATPAIVHDVRQKAIESGEPVPIGALLPELGQRSG